MFYDDDLGIENIFFPVCLISEYASATINVYLYSIHLGIWNVTAVFQFPNRLSLGCVTSPRRQSGVYRRFNVIRVGLNNAATSRILVNPTVIPILLSDKKVSCFNVLFQIRPEYQSASLYLNLG